MKVECFQNSLEKISVINFDTIYLLTAIGLTPDGGSAVHIYTQTMLRTTHSTQTVHRIIIGKRAGRTPSL